MFSKNAAVVFIFREKYSDGSDGNNPLNLKNSSTPMGNIQTIINAAARKAGEENRGPIDGQWMFGNVSKHELGLVTINTKHGEFVMEENLVTALSDWEYQEQDRKDKLEYLEQMGEPK
jgi:hypothetical protein